MGDLADGSLTPVETCWEQAGCAETAWFHVLFGYCEAPRRAREENRTPDLFITNELLCRLSYSGAGVRLPALLAGEREEKGL